MAPPTGQHQATAEQRFYVRARVVLAVLLVGAAAYELVWTNQRENWALFWFLWAILVAGTVGLSLAARRGDAVYRRIMGVLIGPDLIVLAGYSYVLHGGQDAFYPIAVLLPIAYALATSKQMTWVAGIGSMVAYGVGHAAAHPLDGEDLFTFGLKIAAIPLIATMVADSVDKQRERRLATDRIAEEKAALNVALNQRLSELQAVSEITELIHSSLDFEKVGPMVLEIISKVLGIDTCCLFVIDKEQSETLFSASHGQVGRLPAYPGLESDGSLEDHFACMTAFDHHDSMVLFCASGEDLQRLTSEDKLVLGAVASELVVAVENSRLYKLTKKLAITDELTGLANYRQLQQKLDEEIERAKRYSKRVSLIMVDIDDFKRFNDTQGHIAGDVALAEIGRVMASVVREVDLVARYGGEEFSVVLPETDAPGAFVAAEKVREAVSNHLFADADGKRTCGMTVSLGVATFPAHARDKETLLREADDALYRAKHGGKNRVRTPIRRPGDPDETDSQPTDETGV